MRRFLSALLPVTFAATLALAHLPPALAGSLESPDEIAAAESIEAEEVAASTPEFTDSTDQLAASLGSLSVESASSHQLASVATRLGRMSSKQYRAVQRRWLGTAYPACNFFVITAMCESGLCSHGPPSVSAAEFGGYLMNRGWERSSLAELKRLFESHAGFDAILQRSGKIHGHGHVLIPVGLDSHHQLIVAEGQLGAVSHSVRAVSDRYLTQYLGGFRAYVSR